MNEGRLPTVLLNVNDALSHRMSGALYRLDIGVREHRPFMRPW